MPVEIVKAESPEIKKNIAVVRKMTRGMSFDENMGRVNWRLVRLISGLGYKFMPKEKSVSFRRGSADGCKFELAVPENITSDNIILYIHGGGFVSGSAGASRGYCSMLAAYSGCRVAAPDYPLAPEKPFPHGLDCCETVLRVMIREYPGARIALVGESAGANLCISLTLREKYAGCEGAISSVTVHSPFIDFTGQLDRSVHTIDDFTVKVGCLRALNEIYAGEHDSDDPLISPYYGDFEGFPPTFITCDRNETLYADSVWLYRKLDGLGTEVNMIEAEGAFHAFAAMGTQSPETVEILRKNVRFIKNHF